MAPSTVLTRSGSDLWARQFTDRQHTKTDDQGMLTDIQRINHRMNQRNQPTQPTNETNQPTNHETNG